MPLNPLVTLAALAAGATSAYLALPAHSASATAPSAATVQQGALSVPRFYAVGHNPGERVPDVSFMDVDGRRGSLHALAGRAGVVLIVRDAECPVSQRYSPRIAEMEKTWGARGYTFAYVDITPHSRAEAKAVAAKAGLAGRTIHDDRKVVSMALRARTTGEAFVVDSRGTLRYRGAIDDQFGITWQRDRATSHWLRDALGKVSAGEAPLVPSTESSGCIVSLSDSTRAITTPVTYHNRISRIVQENCQSCHRVGGLAPMPLETYPQVRERRATIEVMTKAGRMPPWSAHKDVGEWANDRRLRDQDLKDLLSWIAAGAPEGNPREAPLPRTWTAGWNIGKPDAVVRIPEPMVVPAQGVISYQYAYVKTDFPEDKWITSIEIRPTAPRVVHHVLVFLEEPGRELALFAPRAPGTPVPPRPQAGVDGFFAATAPGAVGTVFPLGTGKRLPKGAWLKFQLHYQPNGTATTDRTEIGFRFSGEPLREVESLSAFNLRFAIPPNVARHEVKATHTFRQAGMLLSLFPHMHLRGAAFRYDLEYPDGRMVPLLDVPRFDFNWQSYYEFKRPFEVPAGARLHATAWYDNSRNNPFNPDPSATVRFGEQTFEEMMIGYFDFVATPTGRTAAGTPPGRR
jgi:mono/diheme cytochrome c family protein